MINNRDIHLSEDEFFSFLVEADSKYNIKTCKKIYQEIVNTWTVPSKWVSRIEHDFSGVYNNRHTIYWVYWAMKRSQKLPLVFIKKLRKVYAKCVLKATLNDYIKLEAIIDKLLISYKNKAYIMRIYQAILKLCLFTGVSSIQSISFEDIKLSKDEDLFTSQNDPYIILNILYYMGYRDKPAGRDLAYGIISRKTKISNYWESHMIKIVDQFIDEIKRSKSFSYEIPLEKMRYLNSFAEWYCTNKNILVISNLMDFTRADWLEYIDYIRTYKDFKDKTKKAMVLAVFQFINWLKVKYPMYINVDIIMKHEDYSIFKNESGSAGLSFSKREYGEKILNYLINDFTPHNAIEEFYREAIIIAANSGMRISEIRRLDYNCCYWSEEEGCHKIILRYVDKLNNIGRSVYITKDGYEAIIRVKKLRKKYGLLVEKDSDRSDSSYIHLFEYMGRNPLESSRFYDFIEMIKIKLNLFDESGKVVRGGMHAFRHMYSMTVFECSGYNIGVVRYLLGHKKYSMSLKYLEEEVGRRISDMRQVISDKEYKISGNGLNTILELITDGRNAKEFIALKKILDSSNNLSELITNKSIRKVGIGYCIKPCENASRCIRCNKFIITENEKDEIISCAKELFDFICFKVSLYESIDLALKDFSIKDDIVDFNLLLKEMDTLGISTKTFRSMLLKEGDQFES